jgi:iron complex transport system ATP-binding protein
LSGKIEINEEDINKLDRKNIGKLISYVPQCHNCTFSYSVSEVAVMGRNPFFKAYQEPSKEDYLIVEEVLSVLRIEHLKNRKFRNLSGGEKKLVLIARALVQKPSIIIMDEPTAELDIKNTVMILERIKSLKQEDIALLVTTHSPREAKTYADQVLMIKEGDVFAYGNSELLDDKKMIDGLYGLSEYSEMNSLFYNYL